jgi:micrococcal nuclease
MNNLRSLTFRPATIALLVGALIFSLTTAYAREQRARVVDVIDGDTIIVSIAGKREHVRLIGIDSPESRPNRRAELQSRDNHRDQKTILELGKRASSFSRQLIRRNEEVTLEYDQQQRDHYQRLLAYVWLPNQTMANEEILKAGFAYLLTVPPNVKYRERFAAAFKDARAHGRGLWASSNGHSSPTASTKGGNTTSPATRGGGRR